MAIENQSWWISHCQVWVPEGKSGLLISSGHDQPLPFQACETLHTTPESVFCDGRFHHKFLKREFKTWPILDNYLWYLFLAKGSDSPGIVAQQQEPWAHSQMPQPMLGKCLHVGLDSTKQLMLPKTLMGLHRESACTRVIFGRGSILLYHQQHLNRTEQGFWWMRYTVIYI